MDFDLNDEQRMFRDVLRDFVDQEIRPVASEWEDSGRLALVWAATMPFALVVEGAHVPSDVVTGCFIALTLAAWAPNLLFGAGAAYLLLTVRT